MIDLTSNYWNNRYLDKEIGWDLGSPSTPLKAYFDQLMNKDIKILIPGCGNAYEAEYLHHLGYKNVYVLDFSEKALKQFKERVPTFPENHLICDNFFHHKGNYDLIVEQTFFCAINPSLRKDYVQHCYDSLNTQGKIVGLLFNDPLNEDHPPFGGSTSEYKDLFSPLFGIDIMESANNSIEPRMGRELFIKLKKNA
jgi:SAM-dependent methyltransferase